ncbi:MAG: hypothetical protein ACLU7B_06770 [Bifidobacterium adolescentis]
MVATVKSLLDAYGSVPYALAVRRHARMHRPPYGSDRITLTLDGKPVQRSEPPACLGNEKAGLHPSGSTARILTREKFHSCVTSPGFPWAHRRGPAIECD